MFGDCYIECTKDGGCQNTIIDATQHNGNFEPFCEDADDVDDDICRGIIIHGSEIYRPEQNGTSFVVTCGRDRNACMESTIICSQGMDCEIDCHTKDKDVSFDGAIFVCKDANVIGPTDYKLRVECEDNNACQGAIINSQESSLLELTCGDVKSCCGVEILCPVHVNQNNMCRISGMLHVVFVRSQIK